MRYYLRVSYLPSDPKSQEIRSELITDDPRAACLGAIMAYDPAAIDPERIENWARCLDNNDSHSYLKIDCQEGDLRIVGRERRAWELLLDTQI